MDYSGSYLGFLEELDRDLFWRQIRIALSEDPELESLSEEAVSCAIHYMAYMDPGMSLPYDVMQSVLGRLVSGGRRPKPTRFCAI
jgi:hypothetical protein